DGAIGAAVGEIVGEALTNGKTPAALTAKEREQILAYSKLVAGSMVALNNGDVNAAANAAQVAVESNALKWTSTTAAEIKKEAEQRKKQDDWVSILLPAHAAVLSKEGEAADLSNFRGGLRNISLSGAVVSGYSPVVLVGGKTYFVASSASVVQGAVISTFVEGQPYRVSDLAYDATLGVLINRTTGKMVTWANTDNKTIQRYLKIKGETTNYVLGKGASETINHILKDKNTVLVEVPEWRKSK
ncbi:VENN motif pre-toxin domain-containing protein, partial [Neisseria dentiae]|uniref:VENN motif pre-toxin domain-containing protein n=1 Tax=Neisseria dentiae TaxID=194197 RepID=UPI00211C1CDD